MSVRQTGLIHPLLVESEPVMSTHPSSDMFGIPRPPFAAIKCPSPQIDTLIRTHPGLKKDDPSRALPDLSDF